MKRPDVSPYINSSKERTFDLFVACTVGSAALVAGSISEGAIVIRNGGGINPLFRQERVGLEGKLFSILKFRTWDYQGEKLEGADIVRDIGLDESPQFINVVEGDMSVVSYRPIRTIDENHTAQRLKDHFIESSPYYPNNWLHLRKQAKPGITGPSQTMPLRPDAGSLQHLVDVVDAEYDYLNNATLLTDIDFVFHRTPITLVMGHNPTTDKI